MPLNQKTLRRIKWRYLKCPNCNKINLIPTIKNRRKFGHIKTMQCFYCGAIVDMIEVSEWNNVKLENMEKSL